VLVAMEKSSTLPFGRWALFGLALVAGVLWMFAVTWWEKPTLYITAVSGAYSIAALSWWRTALLNRRWLQVMSAPPLAVAVGCMVAMVAWGLAIVI
jgi:hypothetical protein